MKKDPGSYIVIFSLWLLMFSASSQLQIISPILSEIGKSLNINPQYLGTLITAYAAMLSTFALVMGPVSDKIGRRRILLIGAGMMSVSLLLHQIAYDYYSLLFFRALAGAAGGVLSGSVVSYVGDYFPYSIRGWANGWVMTGMAFGQIAGVPLGTLLAEWMGFRAPFTVFGVTMLASFLLILLKVPQPNVERIRDRLTIPVVLRNYLAMLRDPRIQAVAATYFVMFLGIAFYVVYLPTWLRDEFSVNGEEIALLFFVGGIANVFMGPFAGRMSDQVGRKSLILTSCFGLAVAMGITTLFITEFWKAYVLFFISMILVAVRISPFQALISELVPAHKRGTMMSLTISIGQLGMGIGGGLAGTVYAEMGFSGSTYIAAVSVILMGLIVWRFIPEPPLAKEYEGTRVGGYESTDGE